MTASINNNNYVYDKRLLPRRTPKETRTAKVAKSAAIMLENVCLHIIPSIIIIIIPSIIIDIVIIIIILIIIIIIAIDLCRLMLIQGQEGLHLF